MRPAFVRIALATSIAAAVLALAGCSPSSVEAPFDVDGAADSGTVQDAGTSDDARSELDAGTSDAGLGADAGEVDAGETDDEGVPPVYVDGVDVALCQLWPGGYLGNFQFVWPADSQLAVLRSYYTVRTNASSYSPIISIRLTFDSEQVSATEKGKVQVAESPQPDALPATYRVLSISKRPCDYGAGGSALLTAAGSSPNLRFRVQANEGYFYDASWIPETPANASGVVLTPNVDYYLNIVSGVQADMAASTCVEDDNCGGIVADIWRPVLLSD